jgi:hypothetical protein
MSGKNKIRNLSDLRDETSRVRKSVGKKEKELSDDIDRIIESVSPWKLIAEISGKILSNAPALFTAYSFIKKLFSKKKKTQPE